MPDVSLSTEGVWSELRANIRGFVGRRVRQPADVDDIVQRVFLQVHRALPTLRDSDRLHAWVYQITRRAIADYYRAPSHTREVPAGGGGRSRAAGR
jgi:RNA polymerase sigma-70 factor (ECF subfamily)